MSLAWRMSNVLVPVMLAGGAIVAWLAIRRVRRWSRGEGRFLPARPGPPAPATRIAEAAILGTLSCAIILTGTVAARSPEYSTRLAEQFPRATTVAWVLAGTAMAATLAALLPALRGRTLVSLVLCTIVVSGYCGILEDPARTIARVLPIEAFRPVVSCRFRVYAFGDDISEIRADVWVNGVCLGRSPVTLERDELEQRVPAWTELPASLTDASAQVILSHRIWHETLRRNENTWACVSLAEPARGSASRPAATHGRLCWLRARVAGQWAGCRKATCDIRSDESGVIACQTSLFVDLPDRDSTPQWRLINQARLNRGQVGPAWLAAMDGLGDEGTGLLWDAAQADPRLRGIPDAWATWRYHLDRAATPDEAWAVFEQIRTEAARNREYWTDSVAGRAVELLTPRIDPERLLAAAEAAIANSGSYEYFVFEAHGRGQFGARADTTRVPPGIRSGQQYAWMGGGRMSYDCLPIAHAVWMLDQALDAANAPHPNQVEARIPAALLRKSCRDNTVILVANALGGCPDFDRFLLRQPWWQDVRHGSGHSWSSMYLIGGAYVNKWLYQLACLDSPAGRTFRSQHEAELMALADQIISQASFASNLPEFLFLDKDLGASCLGMKYWPRLAPAKSVNELELRFAYLARLEPLSTIRMYVDAWRNHRGQYSLFDEGPRQLATLSTRRRQEILAALAAEVRRDISNMNIGGLSPAQARDSVLLDLQQACEPERRMTAARNALDVLRRPGGRDRYLASAEEWLTHCAPDDPLVGMLAADPEPKLRLAVMGALRTLPTPDNLALLDRLLVDPDEQVRRAATTVRADLDRLAVEPPGRIAGHSAGSAPP